MQLQASGGTSYSWSGPNAFTAVTSSPQVANAGLTAAGDYTVTVTNGSCQNIFTMGHCQLYFPLLGVDRYLNLSLASSLTLVNFYFI